MIETSNLDSASSSIGKIASQMSDLASSVVGYDTSCDDGFDFASVKGLIESNIKAWITKVQNTATILNTVSQSHTELQSSLKFEDPAETTKKSSSSEGTNSENSNSTNNYHEIIERTPADKISIYKEFQDNLKSIYTLIFNDLEILFYQLI